MTKRTCSWSWYVEINVVALILYLLTNFFRTFIPAAILRLNLRDGAG
jgi:hypothetical protein